MTALLATEGLRKRFGELAAVDGVDLAIGEGVRTAIIGPNGAGKTTLINLLTGALVPDAGRVLFRGEEVTRLPTHQRVRQGIGRSFQLMNIFPRLTVEANILVPVLARHGLAHRALAPLRAQGQAAAEAERTLRGIGLWEEREQPAGALSHGDQRLLELGLAVASAPALCFLDEPSSGMNPVERGAVLDLVRRLSDERRTTFVIIEHDMDVVFSLAQRIVVMNRGRILADGTPAEIREDREVRAIYLGEEGGP
jgi:branched-chain amino acid transport system ATP-binding protein